jgi:hypothetical protein
MIGRLRTAPVTDLRPVVASGSPPHAAAFIDRMIEGGLLLLPLLCWPGLDHPFSTPKIWLLAALDLALAARLVLHRAKRPYVAWPWLLFPAALAISALAAPYVSLGALLLAVLPLPLCWAASQGLLDTSRVMRSIRLGSALESAIAVLQYVSLDPLRWLGWQPEAFPGSRMRVYGTLGNPDFVAAWLCATLPLWLAGPRRKTVLWPAVALQLAAIFCTGSRVFVLALPAAAVVLLLRPARLGKASLVALPVAAALLWLSPARPLDVTVRGRLYYARVAVSHCTEIPPAGFGPGAFPLKFAVWQVERLAQRNEEAKFAGAVDHAHNDYLELLIDYGPLGLAAFLALCGWLVHAAWRRPGNPAAWGSLAALLAIAAVDFPLHRPAEWVLFWLLLGVLTQTQKGESEECRDR